MDYQVNITPARKPKNSMVINLGVQQGYNQIRQKVGDYSAAYLSETSISNNIFELVPMQYYGGASSNLLIIRCDGPISVTYKRKLDGSEVVIYVKNVLVLDELTESFLIQNLGSDIVKVFLHQALGDSLDKPVVPLPENPVLSVNGQLPDPTGNVEVNTGVMTVDGVLPDNQGNVQTDEGTFLGS